MYVVLNMHLYYDLCAFILHVFFIHWKTTINKSINSGTRIRATLEVARRTHPHSPSSIIALLKTTPNTVKESYMAEREFNTVFFVMSVGIQCMFVGSSTVHLMDI